MKRVTSTWTGFAGAPGYTQLYFGELDNGTVAATRAFWNSLTALLPNDVTITVANSGDLIDAVTGDITGGWTETSTTPVVGINTGSWANAAGLGVNWVTPAIINGRRLRGRTFIVPAASAAFDNDGSLTGATVTTLTAAAQALVADASSELLVWHRPKPGSGGSSAVVTSVVVPDKTFVLRSRRD